MKPAKRFLINRVNRSSGPEVFCIKMYCNTGVFLWVLRNFKNTFLTEHLQVTASAKKNIRKALCALVPTCLTCLCAYVLTCQHVLRTYVFTCQRTLRPLVPTCSRALCTQVMTCLACNFKKQKMSFQWHVFPRFLVIFLCLFPLE